MNHSKPGGQPRRVLVALSGVAALALGPLSAPGPASAATGGFCAGGGRVTVITGEEMVGIAVQRKGGFLAFGSARPHQPKAFVKRFHADGTREASFGTRLLSGPGTAQTLPEAALVDSRNRIVVAGDTDAVTMPEDFSGEDIALWRLLPSGALDTSFGQGGYVRYGDRHLAATEHTVGLAIDAHDRPVVAGYEDNGTGPAEPLVVRFTAHGRPDRTFNKVHGTGVPYFVPPLPAHRTAAKIEVQRDGALVISTSGPAPMSLARIVPGDVAGTGVARLDIGFGRAGDGLAAVPQLALDSGFHVLPRGRVLVFGQSARHTRAAVARLTRSGVVDHSYGLPGGILLSGIPSTEPARRYIASTVLLPHGQLAISGGTVLENGSRTFIARLGPRGGLERRFGKNGLHVLDSPDVGSMITETPDGHLLVARERFATDEVGLVYRFHRNLTRAACR